MPTTVDQLADLTPAQREAVTHMEGPLLVLAGAGSGKTRVITRRVAYLLHQGVRPYNILAITFTNKAAGEMRQRVDALVPQGRVLISTFHSLGARLLRQYADRLQLDRNFTIYDQDDRRKLIKAALEAAGIDDVHFKPERIEPAISKAKNQLLTPAQYAQKADDFFTQTVAQVYPFYEKKLRDANAVDFDDLLMLPALALQHDAELRADLDARFRFVLIDEYQDTNTAQYAIARALSVDHPNLCVVGDPDQSIYGWRGANIRNILNFERDFPDARVITLERNYRSTQSILAAASHLIAHNSQRKPKNLVTENPVGQPVTVLTFESGQDEAAGIARRIRQAVESENRNYRDFAVFMRINALSRSLESAFIQQRVPYQIVRGLAFYDRKENRDVLAYLRLVLNPRDDLSFLRVVNEPARGIGKVSLDHLRVYASPREMSLLSAAAEVAHVPEIKGKAAAALKNFAQIIHELSTFRDSAPEEVIRQVLDRSGYRKMLKESHEAEDQERLANIEELITAARQFAAAEEEEEGRTIADFLENITLASDVDSWDERQDCVSVMTLHASKGLEFPVVYVLAMEDGLLPHERSRYDHNELEEERRLAFVGMTRSKQELYLCHARLREFRGRAQYAIPSTFLNELPEDGVETIDLCSGYHAIDEWRGGGKDSEEAWAEAGIQLRPKAVIAFPTSRRESPPSSASRRFAEGTLVRHESYGQGRVTEITGHGAGSKVKVRFPSVGERTFLAEKAKLDIVPGS